MRPRCRRRWSGPNPRAWRSRRSWRTWPTGAMAFPTPRWSGGSPNATPPRRHVTSAGPTPSATSWRRRGSCWKTPRTACGGEGNNTYHRGTEAQRHRGTEEPVTEFAEIVFWIAVAGACLSYVGYAAWRSWFIRRVSEYLCVECGHTLPRHAARFAAVAREGTVIGRP